MELFHFADKRLRVIKAQRPQHGFTKDYGLPLSYWYRKPKIFEPSLVSGSIIHRARILSSEIYDLNKNNLKLPLSNMPIIVTALKFLKRAGFSGVRIKMSGYDLISLFYTVPVEVCAILSKKRG